MTNGVRRRHSSTAVAKQHKPFKSLAEIIQVGIQHLKIISDLHVICNVQITHGGLFYILYNIITSFLRSRQKSRPLGFGTQVLSNLLTLHQINQNLLQGSVNAVQFNCDVLVVKCRTISFQRVTFLHNFQR